MLKFLYLYPYLAKKPFQASGTDLRILKLWR